MKLKKIIIGIFTTIGVLSVLLCLVGIGYMMGTGTDLGTITSADRGASTGTVVDNRDNPTTPSNPTNPTNPTTPSGTSSTTDFVINNEDYFYDESGKLQYTLELIDFVKSFDGFSSLDNKQIIQIIESQIFADKVEFGSLIGNVQKKLTEDFSDRATIDYILSTVVTPSSTGGTLASNQEVNGGYGDTSQVEDSNKGGSDEDEKTPEDEQQGIDNSDNINDTSTPDNTDTDNPTPENNINNDESKPQDPSIETGSEVEYTFTQVSKWMYATNAVNTRQGPSTDFDKVGNLNKGDMVFVTGQCNETGWYMVLTDNSGMVYVTSKYLSETPPATPTPAPTEAPKQEESKPTTAPSQSEQAKPTTTPTKAPSGNVVVDGVEGTYVTALGQQFFIPNGLEESSNPILINSSEEAIAWSTKYPDGRFERATVTIDGKETQIRYFIPAGVGTAKFDAEDLEQLLNSTLW